MSDETSRGEFIVGECSVLVLMKKKKMKKRRNRKSARKNINMHVA